MTNGSPSFPTFSTNNQTDRTVRRLYALGVSEESFHEFVCVCCGSVTSSGLLLFTIADELDAGGLRIEALGPYRPIIGFRPF